MAKAQHSFEALKQYLPDRSFDLVMPLILAHKVHLTVTRERQTKLGDYRNAWGGQNHRISVNGNLNKYAFLITLLHELAHLLAFEQFGNRIAPHGREWKRVYAGVLHDFLKQGLFPEDISQELMRTLKNPGASTCSEDGLQRVLLRYDQRKPGVKMVEELAAGQRFVLPNGRVFIRGEQLRKRIKCFELPGMRAFLFSPLYEVKEI